MSLGKSGRVKNEPLKGTFCQSSTDSIDLTVCKILLCPGEMWEGKEPGYNKKEGKSVSKDSGHES